MRDRPFPSKKHRAGIVQHLIAALLTLLLSAGCNNVIDPLYGHELGRAESAVYGYDYNTRNIIVVFSNLENLCAKMTSDSQPMGEGDWVVSAWRTADGTGGFFSTVENGAVVSHETTGATLDVRILPSEAEALEGDPCKGTVELVFENGDTVATRFKTYYCSQALLNGLQ